MPCVQQHVALARSRGGWGLPDGFRRIAAGRIEGLWPLLFFCAGAGFASGGESMRCSRAQHAPSKTGEDKRTSTCTDLCKLADGMWMGAFAGTRAVNRWGFSVRNAASGICNWLATVASQTGCW